ncbi:hypothetical protein HAX54_020092 [Datura stramonium]|uniref:Uncharacterized protein n=1 Tax=Datura stramonium TaxID=4076 RepID=A0ABS8S2G1_DATST|nr:hypothetical protein [Datura stramonium]
MFLIELEFDFWLSGHGNSSPCSRRHCPWRAASFLDLTLPGRRVGHSTVRRSSVTPLTEGPNDLASTTVAMTGCHSLNDPSERPSPISYRNYPFTGQVTVHRSTDNRQLHHQMGDGPSLLSLPMHQVCNI